MPEFRSQSNGSLQTLFIHSCAASGWVCSACPRFEQSTGPNFGIQSRRGCTWYHLWRLFGTEVVFLVRVLELECIRYWPLQNLLSNKLSLAIYVLQLVWLGIIVQMKTSRARDTVVVWQSETVFEVFIRWFFNIEKVGFLKSMFFSVHFVLEVCNSVFGRAVVIWNLLHFCSFRKAGSVHEIKIWKFSRLFVTSTRMEVHFQRSKVTYKYIYDSLRRNRTVIERPWLSIYHFNFLWNHINVEYDMPGNEKSHSLSGLISAVPRLTNINV